MIHRILLAEDDEQGRDSMERILSAYGFEVTAVEDGRAALEIILSDKDSSQTFSLLILDDQMPHLTGRKLIAELIRRKINIPTLLITGFGGEHFEEEAKRLGCKGILYKPFETKLLIATIERVLDETHN